MKRLIFASALVAASSGYSLTLQDAEILEHHSWLSNPDNNRMRIAGQAEDKSILSSILTNARVNNVSGTVNNSIKLVGSHGFLINNTTGTYQTYTVNISLCAKTTCCFYDETTIGLYPNGTYANNPNTYLTCTFAYPGNYTLQATTTVIGDTSSKASGRGLVYISQ